ncbi:MAG: hypothetical protein DI585_00770 [Pseudomonas fluorescens]|nr:MAG: hypothetical protein DI585_00770 [Pseudomonas fluorescens]
MNFSLDLPLRLAYLKLDGRHNPQLATDLRRTWQLIEAPLQTVLTEFYRHVGEQPHLAKLFVGREIPRIQQAQFDHWKATFMGGFDADYEMRVKRIGMAHAKIGLGPRWFFGAYCLVLAELGPHIHRRAARGLLGRKNAESERLTALFQRVVFADMDSIYAVYEHLSNQQHAEERAGLMQKMMNSFDTEVAGQLATVAAASEQLSSTAREIGQQARSVSDGAGQARALSLDSRETNSRLTEATREITSVVDLIQDVAEQTNLLALNAAIEAARAGDAGRGFAVVANEVKKLAQTTADATDGIRKKILEIQQAVDKTVHASAQITHAVEMITDNAGAISTSLGEQAQATGDISHGMVDVQSSIKRFFSDLAN